MSGWDRLPWATMFVCGLTTIYALVGGAVVIWGDPGALSFQDYGKYLVGFAFSIAGLAVGRGIRASKSTGTATATVKPEPDAAPAAKTKAAKKAAK